MDIGNFLRALMRDVAWGFFYGWVNFDDVIGTVNHYKSVDLYAGSLQRHDEGRRRRPARELPDRADPRHLRADARRLDQRELRPVRRAAGNRLALRPQERQQHRQDHPGARAGQALRRPEGRPRRCAATSAARRSTAPSPTCRRTQPELHPEPGFENEVHAFNLFALPVPLAGHLEPELHLGRQVQLHVPDHRGAHPADHPRQRPRRVVLPDDRRDPLGLRRQEHRQAAGARDHEGRRHGRHARLLPPPGLQPEALDAAGVGERLAEPGLRDPEGRERRKSR